MTNVSAPAGGTVDYVQVQQRPEFAELRRTHRSFVFPMTALFLLWYLAYVLFAAFQPDLMAISVFGNVNVGLLLGLSQFVTTFIITGLYVWFTNKRLDPKSSVIRHELEAKGVGLPQDTAQAPAGAAPAAKEATR
ncbi:DUF485 domain-containing protein [Nesterenkonia muleiensis]|uniref:DUF485 domain-containing protein n=1 Tax=Nesterenkonia muleiensis TaxID=2282648 RepID=UPI000E76D282|nr:DUF485 domain-containing protein [Nesterenkonia muleiensis]